LRLAWLAPALAALALSLTPSALAQAPGGEIELQIYDRIYLNADPERGVEGKLLEETAESYLFRYKDATSVIPIARELVHHIERADRPETVAEERLGQLASGDSEGFMAVARFCEKHELLVLGRKAALKAATARPQFTEAYRTASRLVRAEYSRVEPEFHPALRERELMVYERAEAASALEPDLRLAKARLLKEEGAQELALRELEIVLKQVPLPEIPGDDEDPADSTGETGDPEPAAAPAPELQPVGDPGLALQVRLELGDLALWLGRPQQAARAFEAVTAEPSVTARAHTGLGLARFALGEYEAAATAFQAAADAASEDANARVLLGVTRVFQGDLEGALAQFKEAKRTGDSGIERLIYAGLVHGLQGDIERGIASVDQALAIEETRSGLLVRGFLHELEATSIGDGPDAAFEHYERVRDAGGRLSGLASLALAEARARRGESEAAQSALTDAARSGYPFPNLALRLARIERQRGNLDAAIRFAHYGESQRSESFDHIYEVGQCHLAAGNLHEARAAFHRALAVDAESLEAQSGIARVHYGLGEFAEAERAFRAVLEVDPKYAYALEAVRKLEEARARRLWADNFERADAALVRNRWLEEERYGVDVTLTGGRVQLAGEQRNEDGGRTTLTREIGSERIAVFGARLESESPQPAEFGIRIHTARGRVECFVDREGRLVGEVQSGRGEPKREELGAWPETGAHTLQIEIGGTGRSEAVFSLDGREVGRMKVREIDRGGSVRCQIFTAARVQERVRVFVDDARVAILRR
jgi:tetratricopeptide (TPR) repeat protein